MCDINQLSKAQGERPLQQPCNHAGVTVSCVPVQVGYPPFYSDDPMTTCRKIVNWRTCLRFPPEVCYPAFMTRC